MITIPCETCGGFGQMMVGEVWRPCPACMGSGEVAPDFWHQLMLEFEKARWLVKQSVDNWARLQHAANRTRADAARAWADDAVLRVRCHHEARGHPEVAALFFDLYSKQRDFRRSIVDSEAIVAAFAALRIQLEEI